MSNRSNCSNVIITEYPDEHTIGIRTSGWNGDNEVWLNNTDVSKIREFIMKNVIEELEQNIQDIESIAEDGYSTRAEGIKQALLIIKNGGKK